MTSAVDWLAGGERRELARRRIVQAATEVLFERGPERFSVEAVAARAHCSRATLYRHAGGRRELLDQVIMAGVLQFGRHVEESLAHLAGEERVVEGVLVALQQLRAQPQMIAWMTTRVDAIHRLLATPGEFSTAGLALYGIRDPSGASWNWLLRVVLMLAVWPVEDADRERELVRSFVGPAFRPAPA